MKVTLITTTINVPFVLERYRAIGPDVRFIVAGDRKTPHDDVAALLQNLGNATYLSDSDQEKLGYKSSHVIGWNKIMRRNVALLEALKERSDIIVTVDDDNAPLDDDYFRVFQRLLTEAFDGVGVSSDIGWLNPGAFLQPEVYHRGFPYDFRHRDLQLKFSAVQGKRVGVAAGLWLGDPDIDAVERLAKRPVIEGVTALAGSGFVVEPGTWAPFNSQNTAYLGDLAPLLMVLVGVGRFDDIFASFIAQRVMQARGYVIHFGPPFVFQDRNPQSPFVNLKDELFGMETTMSFIRDLEAAEVSGQDVLEDLEAIYRQLNKADYLPAVVQELGHAWLDDVRRATAS